MRFSTRTRYGLRFLLRLAALPPGQLVQLGAIAREEKISAGYLEQIVRALKPLGILHSARGNSGGYCLAISPEKINMEAVFNQLEGDITPVGCLDGANRCGHELTCGTREFWRELDEHTRTFLRSRTLAALSGQCGDENVACGNLRRCATSQL